MQGPFLGRRWTLQRRRQLRTSSLASEKSRDSKNTAITETTALTVSNEDGRLPIWESPIHRHRLVGAEIFVGLERVLGWRNFRVRNPAALFQKAASSSSPKLWKINRHLHWIAFRLKCFQWTDFNPESFWQNLSSPSADRYGPHIAQTLKIGHFLSGQYLSAFQLSGSVRELLAKQKRLGDWPTGLEF